jgi:hypothetical protein
MGTLSRNFIEIDSAIPEKFEHTFRVLYTVGRMKSPPPYMAKSDREKKTDVARTSFS